MLRKWPDWISEKIKGAKSGRGWGRCQERELQRARQLGDPEESAWDLGLGPGVGVGIPSQAGSPFDPKKARMLGHPVETFYLNGVRGGMGQIPG